MQAFLKALARHLDPDDSDVLKKVSGYTLWWLCNNNIIICTYVDSCLQLFSSISKETLNTVIADEFTGGESEVETHGFILTLHILREFQSIHKLLQLLVSKYDVICSSIACLQPVHAKLQVWLYLCHCIPIITILFVISSRMVIKCSAAFTFFCLEKETQKCMTKY